MSFSDVFFLARRSCRASFNRRHVSPSSRTRLALKAYLLCSREASLTPFTIFTLTIHRASLIAIDGSMEPSLDGEHLLC